MKDAYEEYDYYFYVKDGKTHTTALVCDVSLITESGTDTYSYTYDNLRNILTVRKNGNPSLILNITEHVNFFLMFRLILKAI